MFRSSSSSDDSTTINDITISYKDPNGNNKEIHIGKLDYEVKDEIINGEVKAVNLYGEDDEPLDTPSQYEKVMRIFSSILELINDVNDKESFKNLNELLFNFFKTGGDFKTLQDFIVKFNNFTNKIKESPTENLKEIFIRKISFYYALDKYCQKEFWQKEEYKKLLNSNIDTTKKELQELPEPEPEQSWLNKATNWMSTIKKEKTTKGGKTKKNTKNNKKNTKKIFDKYYKKLTLSKKNKKTQKK